MTDSLIPSSGDINFKTRGLVPTGFLFWCNMKKILILSIFFVLIYAFVIWVQTTDEKAEAALRKGINAVKNNDLSTAIINFTKASEIDPKYAIAYYNRGIAYNSLKKYPEALADYTKAIELDPKNVHAFYNRGVAYNALKKYEEALADYTKAIELDPKYVRAYYNRGGSITH